MKHTIIPVIKISIVTICAAKAKTTVAGFNALFNPTKNTVPFGYYLQSLLILSANTITSLYLGEYKIHISRPII